MINTKNINTKIFFEEARKEMILSDVRKKLLTDIADSIITEYQEREKINLNFICTHNSRRSQFSQVWAFFAIEYFGLKNISTYSGGTEATAFHRNTVKSLQQTGFEFNIVDFSHQNPRYLVSFKGTKKSIVGFSKTFDHPENNYPYIAITTCSSADENCPFIPDAISRFHLPYTDPKISDNTDIALDSYLNTSKQIAGELFYIFDMIKKIQ
ncbi:hypothetical protein [Tenacibaculum piscium]|uniref:Arsenate reductase n=1 Tax=Tenacibaculum piscium TaxID=1458515 RepID=A0A2H1YFT8_9FLAO|nr:hypothetical protein [Tenacibaculum piscium]MBE7629725.1 hypothetical protein [Tenacibaculum piscium]MBE7671518.1 hypothetical protein [Tenacibaculum piscium]MBE7690641.1 hypothetical protein [Tenacibaculum piscium]MCG8182560.1 hypothetical protein [Tenacibaculum piscium]MCG8203952.1 hypothetical protein [Tenacibaculum piscium]